MTAATDISGAYFFVYLTTSDLIGSTSTMAREATVAEEDIKRSFVDAPSWDSIAPEARITRRTAMSEKAPVIVRERGADPVLLNEIASFSSLPAGWDGERAAKPSEAAILDATRFIRAASGLELELVPTLHVDGTVILEVGEEGSLRFFGDGRMAYAFDGERPGEATFDGFTIPMEIGIVMTSFVEELPAIAA